MGGDGWVFEDAKNTAVFTLGTIIQGEDWIAQVWHDADDGAWQFLAAGCGMFAESEAAVVSLENVTRLDPTVIALADLPLGWRAWRDAPTAPWQRSIALCSSVG